MKTSAGDRNCAAASECAKFTPPFRLKTLFGNRSSAQIEFSFCSPKQTLFVFNWNLSKQTLFVFNWNLSSAF